jgi:hypothetical protein
MRALAVLAVAVVAGCGSTERSDWERQQEAREEKEESTPLPKPPPLPRRENLVQFEVSGPTQGFRFFIDSASLQIGKEKVPLIQYVVVARSPSGAENVTFEGLRCTTAEYRTYALAQPDGTWGGRPSPWQSIARARVWTGALAREYFCPQAVPVRSNEEALRALRQGGNPFSKGFSGDALLGK